MGRIKNTKVYVFDTIPEPSSFLVGSDQGDGRITKSYRIDTVFGLLPQYGYITDAPDDGQPYVRQNKSWITVPPSGVGSVFSVYGRTGAVTAREEDYEAFYSKLTHTHTESDIIDLKPYLLPSDIGTTIQQWSAALDNVSGVNTGDQTSIVGITGTKSQFNSSLTDGSFMFTGDAPTAHTHTESDITDLGDYIEDAPSDGNSYVRSNNLWVQLPDANVDTVFGRTGDITALEGDYESFYSKLGHTHVKSDITDFSVETTDIVATGTPSNQTWLRGDGVWGTISSGVSSVFGRNLDVVAEAGDYDAFYYTKAEIDSNIYTKTEVDTNLSNYQVISEKGSANGYAPLNGSGKIDETYLPSFVDDVLEYADFASFPATGETGKIYIDLDQNELYRWSGTVYVPVGGTGSVVWGSITGTLSNQTDLQNALNGKVDQSGDTMTGALSITGAGVNPLRLSGDNTGIQNACYITFNESNGTTRQGYIGFPSGSHSDMYMWNDVSSSALVLREGGGINDLIYFRAGASNIVWHSGNDGSGSGLDADTLDGLQRGTTGNYFNVVPSVSPSGVMEVGRYIDFHITDDDVADFSQRLTSTDANLLSLSTGTSSSSFRAYQQSNSYAQLSAGVSGSYLLLVDPNQDSTVIRSYGTTELNGGNLNVNRGALITGDIGVFSGSFLMNKSDGGQMNVAWEDNYYRYRISGGGSINGWRWDNFDSERMRLSSGGTLQALSGYGRYAHNTGHLIGSYNNIGANQSKTNPIYTIGSNYNPADSTLSNMYGIGFSDGGGSSFLNSTDLGSNPSGYGMYVASDGNARIFLSGSNGNIYALGNVYASNFVLTSDARKKTSVEDLEQNLNVRWRKFEMKSNLGEKRYGVIAQELKENHPDFVYDDGTGNLSVKYIDLLVAKMAEKDRQIEELETKIDRIELILKELL